jgi:hypothetical protein
MHSDKVTALIFILAPKETLVKSWQEAIFGHKQPLGGDPIICD